MTVDADVLVDRRRLKWRLNAWRIAAVVLAIAAVAAVVERVAGLDHGDHVARLTVSGVIVEDRDRADALAEVAESAHVRALIVHIDSPGGTVVGGETLYAQLRHVAKNKPVVAVMGSVATSAAYMAAIGCDRIFAHDGSVTGSIGVIMQTADFTRMLDMVGIKAETIKSAPLKAQPNPLEPFSPEAREATRKVVLDIYESFTGMVQERRNLERQKVLPLADGRVFTGRQALAHGLVDQLGGEADAREWLQISRNVNRELPLRDVEIKHADRELRAWLRSMIGNSLIPERLSLDGLVSLWHPGS